VRIGMPTTSYPSYDGDAAGAFVRTLATALARRGHRIDVIAPSVGRQEALGDGGVHVHRIRYAPRALERTFGRHGAPDNLARDPLAWVGAASFPIALARALATHASRWDAIVSHFVVPTSIVAGSFARGRPHVAVAHGTDAHLAASIPGLAARVRRSGTQLACVSSALAARLHAPDAIVQAMGVDRDETRGLSREASRARMGLGRFTALSLARLVPIKGIDLAIRAMIEVDGELVVAGDGPERASLEALARSLGAPVRFVGRVEGDDRRALLAGADVLVAPSRAIGARIEGTPTAVLEALSASLPIVGTRVSGIADAVPDDAGLLSASSSPETLARDLNRLRRDPILRASLANGARHASAPYDADRVAQRFERLLGQGSTTTASAGNAGASADAGMRAG
jgi:glycosyltransferase involved in cell wall biosynthesis